MRDLPLLAHGEKIPEDDLAEEDPVRAPPKPFTNCATICLKYSLSSMEMRRSWNTRMDSCTHNLVMTSRDCTVGLDQQDALQNLGQVAKVERVVRLGRR